ncbi:heme exporter protein CcmD [Craterilacuibacter sinensis]|uniref:Heme exporter protein D n=1 Tax=Craterilacuibacter sinensis TaxID=2686017 RepID=A0A845BXQ3_9NEIS|nr:heme exporter protein CcmD [Craterilacuibacter sinensis]MXR37283.1 heme exporter protein CcmD [Craterilacuibacter sinensis]RQW26620.1 heme exporter protein CcmD [Rhodobacteraceae bacterium CH30]
MNWDSVSAFLHMGGYGLYVWGSFGVTLLLLALETALLSRRARRVADEIRQQTKAARPPLKPRHTGQD